MRSESGQHEACRHTRWHGRTTSTSGRNRCSAANGERVPDSDVACSPPASLPFVHSLVGHPTVGVSRGRWKGPPPGGLRQFAMHPFPPGRRTQACSLRPRRQSQNRMTPNMKSRIKAVVFEFQRLAIHPAQLRDRETVQALRSAASPCRVQCRWPGRMPPFALPERLARQRRRPPADGRMMSDDFARDYEQTAHRIAGPISLTALNMASYAGDGTRVLDIAARIAPLLASAAAWALV
jgi:hypothetical protein